MGEVYEGRQNGGTRLRKSRKEVKTIVVFGFSVMWTPTPECALPDGLSIRCVQLLVKLYLQTKEGETWGKRRKEKLLNEGDTGGFWSPFGKDGTAAKTWIVAQESAMCPTDGASKYEGTSCTDGQFCMSRVWRQMVKSAKK